MPVLRGRAIQQRRTFYNHAGAPFSCAIEENNRHEPLSRI